MTKNPKRICPKPLLRKPARQTSTPPDTGLLNLILLANMVPADVELPLVGEDDQQAFGQFLDRTFPRDKFAALREHLDLGIGHSFPPSYRYTLMREAREALRMIATHQRERSLFQITFHFPWEWIGGWKVDRIRVCESCGLLFYASRNNKLTCSGRCSTARRVREWRKHQSQYEQARKRKGGR